MTIELIKSQFELIKLIANSSKKYRKAVIASADKKLVTALAEIVLNLLAGNININKNELDSLKKYKYVLRQLIQNKSVVKRKKLLIQQGGFLQFLLPAVITGISNIIASAIEKKE
jgi:hypothetical protein